MNPRFSLGEVERIARSGEIESIHFKPGVNLLTGPSNSGKTRWLQMIDYLLGKEKPLEEFLGKEMSDKYAGVRAKIHLNDREYQFERMWEREHDATRVLVDGESRDPRELSAFILEKLEIPLLHYPKGRLLSEYSWPELGWRSLLRQIYRQERFWSDIADAQPPVEQHAVLLQFLGIAERVFSRETKKYYDLKRELIDLDARKIEFETIINEFARKLFPEAQFSAAITEQTLTELTEVLTRQIKGLIEQRERTLIDVLEGREPPRKDGASPTSIEIRLGEEHSRFLTRLEEQQGELDKVGRRIQELTTAQQSVWKELDKFERAIAAGELLTDLTVTHCPVCDQELPKKAEDTKSCYLCGQPYDYPTITDRVQFETSQLREEYGEISQLLTSLDKQKKGLLESLNRTEEAIFLLDQKLLPTRSRIAAVLPPEISALDAERGRVEEKAANAQRIRSMLHSRKELSLRIDLLRTELLALERSITDLSEPLGWEASGDMLAEGINTYLNKLNLRQPGKWNQGPVSVRVAEKYFEITVDGATWSSKLGGNFRCIFLMAYHYGLLTLSHKPKCHYPGFCAIDFPPNPAEQRGDAKNLNYLIEPFVELLSHADMRGCQFIAASREFEPLDDVNHIALDKSWA